MVVLVVGVVVAVSKVVAVALVGLVVPLLLSWSAELAQGKENISGGGRLASNRAPPLGKPSNGLVGFVVVVVVLIVVRSST